MTGEKGDPSTLAGKFPSQIEGTGGGGGSSTITLGGGVVSIGSAESLAVVVADVSVFSKANIYYGGITTLDGNDASYVFDDGVDSELTVIADTATDNTFGKNDPATEVSLSGIDSLQGKYGGGGSSGRVNGYASVEFVE